MLIGGKTEQLGDTGTFILLLLGTKNSQPVPTNTHLQKEMYLLRNMFPRLADKTCSGSPSCNKPYDKIVADETKRLWSSDLVATRPGSRGVTKLTSDGRRILDMMMDGGKYESKEAEKAEMVKHLFNDLTEDEVLAFMYSSYPDQAELDRSRKSVTYERIMSRRKALAMSIYRKDKISSQKAAQIAGQSLEDFLDGLKRGFS